MTFAASHKKRIALFCGHNLIACLVLNRLVPQLKIAGLDVSIFLTEGKKSASPLPSALQDYSFYEGALLREVVTPLLADKDITADSTQSFYALAQHYGATIASVPDPNHPDFVQSVHDTSEYVGAVSIRNYRIFSPDLIQAFTQKGFMWNLHMGDLPELRGVFAPFRALLQNRTDYAWTLHVMEKGIDTGAIIQKCFHKLSARESILQAYLNLVPAGTQSILDAVLAYVSGQKISTQDQSANAVHYYSFPTQDEIWNAQAKGIKLIDRPAQMVLLYLDLFTPLASSIRTGLRDALIQKIAEYEQSKANAQTADPQVTRAQA